MMLRCGLTRRCVVTDDMFFNFCFAYAMILSIILPSIYPQEMVPGGFLVGLLWFCVVC